MADSIASVVNQITSATSGTSTLSSSASIAKNFDSFLRLLTTQLQNQNPLEPLDTNQFTQQLVQFSQVEQQINMNQQLTTLIALQKSAQSATAINYVGATATVDGATARLAGGRRAGCSRPTSPQPPPSTSRARRACSPTAAPSRSPAAHRA